MTQTSIFRTFCGIILLIALSFAILSAPAKAQGALEQADFYEVATTENGLVVSLRLEDLLQGDKDPTNARVWIRISYPSGRLKTMYRRENINCLAETHVTEFIIYVDRRGNSETEAPVELKPILPNSNLAGWAELVCARESDIQNTDSQSKSSSWGA